MSADHGFATVASVVFALGAALPACGARTGLPVGQPDADAAPPPVDASNVVDATACTGTSVPVAPNVPNLYFVLDTSRSMAEAVATSAGQTGQSKWVNVRAAVANLIFDLGPSAQFGATVFPAPAVPDQCAPGVQVMALRPGDAFGATRDAFLAATAALTPNGGTPTAATFVALEPMLANPDSPTYVILATDGGPNCDRSPNISCTIDQCTNNIDGVGPCTPTGPMNCCTRAAAGPVGCLDTTATANAIGALHTAGVKTYVMGIPGSAPYASVLDQMALAGGTARAAEPLYYRVDTADTAALGSTFAQIAAEAMKSCVLTLERAPRDPGALNVYVDGAVVPSDGANGWSVQGRKVTLEGASCASIQGGMGAAGAPTVRVLEGCPTVH
ncbi:MAG TPA: vWA domain-containing protein [Polyangiaceae bacterium]|nr:vWA domain-containing protein [Polyangiaceae bacterium]